jgi:hypothetical protein
MSDEREPAGETRDVDLRHAGRFYDKEMQIELAGMEMSKPGLADLRRRKHSVTLPDEEEDQAIAGRSAR